MRESSEAGMIRPEAFAEVLRVVFAASGANEHDTAVAAYAILDAELRHVSESLLVIREA